MPLDANGIHQYDESETAAPVSDLLNRLAQSVSDAIEPLVQPGPTDWTNSGLVVGAGLTLTGAAYKVDPFGLVTWRGEIYGPAPAANAVILTVPTAIRPTARMVDELVGFSGMATVYLGSFGGTGALEEIRYRNLITGAWPTTSPLAMSLAGLSWRAW